MINLNIGKSYRKWLIEGLDGLQRLADCDIGVRCESAGDEISSFVIKVFDFGCLTNNLLHSVGQNRRGGYGAERG
jgi:hypothetical protein